MSLPSILEGIEECLKYAKPETVRQALVETVEHYREVRPKMRELSRKKGGYHPKGFDLYSPLLEEVIAGEKSFADEMKRLGPHKFLMENMYLFSGNVFLAEEIEYLDKKLPELYRAKK